MYDQDFVIFRGQLFAPPATSAEDLLSKLNDWVGEGPRIKITDADINSKCSPWEDYADTCVQLTETATYTSVLPIVTTTTKDISSSPTQISCATEPSHILPITAVGCLFVGGLLTLAAVLLTKAGVYAYFKLKER